MEWSTLTGAPFRVISFPLLQVLDNAIKACQGQTLMLIWLEDESARAFVPGNYFQLNLTFVSDLHYQSKALLKLLPLGQVLDRSRKACQGQTQLLIWPLHQWRRKKSFYDDECWWMNATRRPAKEMKTWCQCYKKTFILWLSTNKLERIHFVFG